LETEIEAYLRNRLEPDERVLWAGTPSPSKRLDNPNIIGGLILGYCAWVVPLALIATRLKENAPDHQATAIVKGIVNASIFLGMITAFIGSAVRSLLRRSDSQLEPTSYRLTNRNAFVFQGEHEHVRSVKLDTLISVRTEISKSGTGTIQCTSRDLDWWGWDWTGIAIKRPLFQDIKHPRRVRELIMEALIPRPSLGPYEIEYAWERQLRKDGLTNERLVWSAQRESHKLFGRSNLRLSLYALPFFLMPVFFLNEAVESRDPRRDGIGAVSDGKLNAMIVVAVVSIAIGLFLLVIRRFVDKWWRSSTSYGLTPSQAIVSSPGWVRLVPFSSVSSVWSSPEPKGRGTISCRCAHAELLFQFGRRVWSLHRRFEGPLFRRVEGSERVVAQIHEAISKQPRG